MNDIDELITFEPYQSCYEYGYEQGGADMLQLVKNYVTFDCSLDLSKVDDVFEFCKKIEELKEKNNE